MKRNKRESRLSKRKLESYKRAEIVARELRYQLSISRYREEININRLFKKLFKWMNVTGKIKYEKNKN